MDIMGNLIDWSSSSQQDMADMGSNRGDRQQQQQESRTSSRRRKEARDGPAR
jgi:hypothetical protein